MQNYIVREIQCVNACNKVSGGFPYKWDLNVYRGCEHGCKYCFALYTHKYMSSKNFFNEIYVKTNIVEKLEKLLSSKNWKGEVINLGGVTDNYQPAEQSYGIMPDILKTLIKYKNPCIISTKSDLILRDFDLIDELSRLSYVNIASTITCMDENIRKLIEPNGVPSIKRFEMLGEFKKTKASTGLHNMPIIPFLTDNYDNISELLEYGKKYNVDYALMGALNLRGETKTVFLSFIKQSFPMYYNRLCNMYKTGWADASYRSELYKMTSGLMKKYGISNSYMKPMKQRMKELAHEEYTQISLFDTFKNI